MKLECTTPSLNGPSRAQGEQPRDQADQRGGAAQV